MSLFLFLFLLAVSEPGPILSLWFEKPVFWGGAKQRLGFTPQPGFVLTAFSWPWEEDGASYGVWSVCRG